MIWALVMLIILTIVPVQSTVSYGLPDTRPITLTSDSTDDDGGLGEAITDSIKSVFKAFADLIVTPIRALVDSLASWFRSMFSSWYGPILVAVVLIIVYLIIKFGRNLTEWTHD